MVLAENSRSHEPSISYALIGTDLGLALFAGSADGVCCILLGDTEEELLSGASREFPGNRLVNDERACEQWRPAVEALLSGDIGSTLPLDVRGTEFQQRVWAALEEIPSGATASYSEVACSIGAPKAARAVASACASNRIAVAIPCHRVVRGEGSLGGFKWGIERKQQLLEREAGR